MRAKELVPILADIYGVPFETAFAIDRSLAEAGLRTKNRGRSWPEMTRREAVIFLIACMTVQKATKAAEEVQPWLAAEGYLDGAVDDGLREIAERLGYQERGKDGLPVFINLVDFLVALCDQVRAHHWSEEDFKFEISLSHGWAVVTLDDQIHKLLSRIRFQTEAGAKDPVSYETQIVRSAAVYGDALLALAVRTAPEAA